MHPEGEVVVILEGVVEVVTNPDPAFSERVYAASVAKYGMGCHRIEGSYAVRPRVAFAWAGLGLTQTATRWVLSDD